jgi:hypothetical protein
MSEVNVKLMFLVCFCLFFFFFFFFYSVYVLILIFGSYLIRIVINLIKNLLWVLFLFREKKWFVPTYRGKLIHLNATSLSLIN